MEEDDTLVTGMLAYLRRHPEKVEEIRRTNDKDITDHIDYVRRHPKEAVENDGLEEALIWNLFRALFLYDLENN